MRLGDVFPLFCLAGLALLPTAGGEPVRLTVPGQGWQIGFDAPAITRFQGGVTETGFRYQGASSAGFNITIFVEEKVGAATGHRACADHYWPQAKRNPMIDQATVKREDGKRLVAVSYMIQGKKLGLKSDIPNVNLYFECKGKWIDVHISKCPYKESEKVLLDAFVKSLVYGDLLPPAAGK